MENSSGLADLIGNTPLVRLRQVSEQTGCEILGKAEFMNPGGSVKDRTALGIIRDAERRGVLRAGGRIVEGTAGNTGIGLSLLANALGYRTTIVIPETQSPEKIEMLMLCGAELRLVPAVPASDPNHYVKISGRLAQEYAAREAQGAVWANQFDNTANRAIHRDTTGREIWEQTGGRVDGFICSVGTGGTLAGVAEYLRAQSPAVRIGLADPGGAALYNHYVHGGDRATELGSDARTRRQLGEVEVVTRQVGVDRSAATLGEGDVAPGGRHSERQPPAEQRQQRFDLVHLGSGRDRARHPNDPASALPVLDEGHVEGVVRQAREGFDAHRVEAWDGGTCQGGQEGGRTVHSHTVCRGLGLGWEPWPLTRDSPPISH